MNINDVFRCDRNRKKGATQHASGTTLKQACSECEIETSETFIIQKNRSVLWPGNFLEDCLSQQRVVWASENCLSHRYVKFYVYYSCKLSSFERDAVINPPLVISFTT